MGGNTKRSSSITYFGVSYISFIIVLPSLQLDFESGSTLVWLAQVKGLNYVRLLPEPVCAQQCQDLDLVLETRDIREFEHNAAI